MLYHVTASRVALVTDVPGGGWQQVRFSVWPASVGMLPLFYGHNPLKMHRKCR